MKAYQQHTWSWDMLVTRALTQRLHSAGKK